MKLDDLRSILLSERETGRLTAIAPDIFEKGHAELAAITKKVYETDDPFSDEARGLIDETLAIRETLADIFAIRSRKILALTTTHAEGHYYDREEVKRMIPPEKAMFERITAGIAECSEVLLHNAPHIPHAPLPLFTGDADEGEPAEAGGDADLAEAAVADKEPLRTAAPQPPGPITHPCALVRVLQDMESFMGVDGRVYSLSKGDIVTLPERNAAVLSERNIVLNINLCK
jgi:DNA replication factor GINS